MAATHGKDLKKGDGVINPFFLLVVNKIKFIDLHPTDVNSFLTLYKAKINSRDLPRKTEDNSNLIIISAQSGVNLQNLHALTQFSSFAKQKTCNCMLGLYKLISLLR